MTKVIICVITLIGVAAFLLACKSKKVAVDTATAPALVWGSGGGFTGKEVSYRMLESGAIYQMNGVGAGQLPMKSIKAKVAKAMFSAAKDLNLAEISLNKPGNMYFFVELQVEGKPYRITWGDGETETPKKIKDFHLVLNQLVLKGTK
jgi:hypothetical protein